MKKNALLSFFLIKLNSLTSKRQNVIAQVTGLTPEEIEAM